MTRVLTVSAESSGDVLAMGLVKNLQALGIPTQSLGGGALAKDSPVDVSGLNVLGFAEGLRALPRVKQVVRDIVSQIVRGQYAAVVLIDSWGLSIRVAQALKAARWPGLVVKYVAPQVFAMREGRAKTLAASVDHLLTIHSFDAPYFTQYGLPVTAVGNPALDDIPIEIATNPDPNLVLVCLGSRPSELARLAAPFSDAVTELKTRHPNLQFVNLVSDELSDAMTPAILPSVERWPESEKHAVFARAGAAIACSGTVTTQLAAFGVPTVVGYRISPLTFAVARRIYKPRYVSLVNISAGRELMPERLQSECTGETLAMACERQLGSTPEERARLREAANSLRGPRRSASAAAAEAIRELLN